MSTDTLRENDVFVSRLRDAIFHADGGLAAVPGLVRCILEDGRWRERLVARTGETVRFKSFSEFVATPPLEGLGATIDVIKRICKDDAETRDLIDQAVKESQQYGGDRKSEKIKSNNVTLDFGEDVPRSGSSGMLTHTGKDKQLNGDERPAGNSADYALRKLRKDRPDLHEQVIRNEVSPHAAMVQAGSASGYNRVVYNLLCLDGVRGFAYYGVYASPSPPERPAA